MPTPKPSNLQLETLVREIKRLRSQIEDAYERANPAPSWEEEKQWKEHNPSPLVRHANQLKKFRAAVVDTFGHDLELRIRLGQIAPDEIYSGLTELAKDCATECVRLATSGNLPQ